MADQSLDGMDDIVADFLVESAEGLDELDQQLVALERDPSSRSLLAAIFRTVHTVKGTSGFLAFSDLERVAHVGETLLARLRDGRATATPHTVTVLLHLVDALRELLDRIETTGTDAGVDLAPVVAEIQAELQAGDGAPAPPAEPGPDAPAGLTVEPDAGRSAPAKGSGARPKPAAAKAAPAKSQPAKSQPAKPAAATAAPPKPAAATAAPAKPQLAKPQPTSSQPAPEPAPAPSEPAAPAPAAPASSAQRPAPVPAPEPAAPAAAPAEASGGRRSSDSTVRVDVDLLEQLMAMVGELVLTRNQVLERAAASADPQMIKVAHRLDLVAADLQDGVMRTRMQPIDHVWSRLPRIVRDLGAQLGRQVRLVTEGADTELDRTLLEAVKDPLTHLVRNAVDHGLEPAADRRAAGKDPVGVVTLRARHEGGQVLVEVSDDGRGMDPAVIGARALERGLVDEAGLAKLSTAEVLGFVFAPGFSTAAAVTSVSGRGVGMDVVKTNIEGIGGSIELESVLGQGSTTRLRVPLTLAIIPALVVACGEHRFAVPQGGLRELVGLPSGPEGTSTERVGEVEVLRLRGHLLPLVRLDDALGLEPVASEDEPHDRVVAVLETVGRRFGLVVDSVVGTQDIVVKPLGGALAGLEHFSGATILGDGGLALILDLQALSRSAREQDLTSRAEEVTESQQEVTQLLLAEVGSRHVAVPLEIVARLEVVAAGGLERIGTRWAMQQHGVVMPVLDVAEHLGEHVGPREDVALIVHSVGSRSVALAVDGILDIAPAVPAGISNLGAPGLSGSVVIDGRIVELLDVRQALLAADPRFYDEVDGPTRGSTYKVPRPRALAATEGAGR
ncbi:chemotaxis protein CheW [Pseudokineococcus sp. 1T1Z-3]|uniref:chemotaxis protein CheW n=1 Tax=Pseudokineococcus sp. 1T1Z-3 TaxID=3132745 RepID=UPI0030AE7645